MTIDHWVASLLAPLAIWVLINGFDDLFIDFAALYGHIRQSSPSEEQLDAAPPRRMAIFVALWKEHRVIRQMLENNVSRMRYEPVEFFIGAYPNDAPTLGAIREAMAQFPNVHLSVCPHPGPTSKADCLNWIYQRMLLHEEQNGFRFDMILTHDAEDLIDPDALRWINYYAQWNDFVQIPVLALPTPIRELSHGVYCDEFAEYQYKDMVARQVLGGFIPSNGVGTGFSRKALEMLAAHYSNRIFEPACLTEDYENGFRVRRLGLPQKFMPIYFHQGRPIATREYFPRQLAAAVRQRSRWVTGITLQSWEFHSVAETLQHGYWFWRDRKSLVSNLVTPLTNILFFYGGATWAWAAWSHNPWGLAHETGPEYGIGLALQAFHTGIRMGCSARIYGFRFACAVPIRVVVGNWINCFATCRAIWTYTRTKLRGEHLRWVKTTHAYPKKRLGEILVENCFLSREHLEIALASQPEGIRLGEHLLRRGMISERHLCEALARQNNLSAGKPDPETVSVPVTRALPAAMARKWKVLPFRIAAGEIHLVGTDPPGEEMQKDIARFSSLEVRVQLVTPAEFEELANQYL